ncbi:MAG: lyase family protein [Spirochaetaceae bacterium]
MASYGVYDSLSPLDHRYRVSNPHLHEELSHYLGEAALVRYETAVEAALLKAHARREGHLSPEDEKAIDALTEKVTGEEVYAEEETTRHNIRALVNVIRRHLPENLAHFVHLGATSMDILDTANALRYRDAVERLLLPKVRRLIQALVAGARRHSETPQVGRTHGRHAVPITFGFFLAEYVQRLGTAYVKIAERKRELAGKLAGAVGAYNAMGLLVDDPLSFEAEVLGSLGIPVSRYSKQIVEPEYLLRLLLEINVAFGILANLADDLRHLQRSEIDEVREYFAPSQVGSSTMPQKRNPWNCEHIKSLWKTFSPRVMSFFLDQVSEHQRDLSNSASGRFVPEFLAGFVLAVDRSASVVEKMEVRPERMLENLRSTGEMVVSEALYVLLGSSGNPEAHEELRRITLKAEASGARVREILTESPGVVAVLDAQVRRRLGCSLEELFAEPERYRGYAVEKTLGICAEVERNILKEESPTNA